VNNFVGFMASISSGVIVSLVTLWLAARQRTREERLAKLQRREAILAGIGRELQWNRTAVRDLEIRNAHYMIGDLKTVAFERYGTELATIELTDEGSRIVGGAQDLHVSAFARRHRKLRGVPSSPRPIAGSPTTRPEARLPNACLQVMRAIFDVSMLHARARSGRAHHHRVRRPNPRELPEHVDRSGRHAAVRCPPEPKQPKIRLFKEHTGKWVRTRRHSLCALPRTRDYVGETSEPGDPGRL